MLVVAMSFFSCNALNAIPLKVVPLKCVSMSNQDNQECRIRPEIININSNKPTFYPYSIKVNKCSGSCNNINDPYSKLCVSDVVKNINVKGFNLMSRANETRHIKWHKTCKCGWRLDGNVCNNKQCWINDKCRWECKELIDNGRCNKGFIWNPSNCECDKLSDVEEYLDYKNCKCRKILIYKLVEEYSENIDGNGMIYISTLNVIPLNDYGKICNSCRVYIVLVIVFVISISIINVLIYFHWYVKRIYTETKIY